MYYHALLRTEDGGFKFTNMSSEKLIDDVLIPYISSQVKLVDYRNSEKVLVNYGSASYLRIAKSTENKIFEGFQIAGALPKGAEGCTQEVRVAVAESYLEGVSTRKVQKVFSNSDLENISASEVPKNHKKVGQIGQ